MALPGNVDLVPVTGKYINLDGTPTQGKVTFTIVPFLTDSSAEVMIPPAPLVATLDIDGAFAISVPATDDPDVDPSGFVYKVVEGFTGGRTYLIEVPLAALPDGVDLSIVAPVSDPGADTNTFVTLAAFLARTNVIALPTGTSVPVGTPPGTVVLFY